MMVDTSGAQALLEKILMKPENIKKPPSFIVFRNRKEFDAAEQHSWNNEELLEFDPMKLDNRGFATFFMVGERWLRVFFGQPFDHAQYQRGEWNASFSGPPAVVYPDLGFPEPG